jgi:RNA polymerase sigma-70 factor (ECF subfamily)
MEGRFVVEISTSKQPAPAVDDGVLIRELYPTLRRFAGVVGPAHVEPDDLVHEALVRTIRRHPLHELEHPSAYLRRAISNLAIDHHRRRARHLRALARLGPPEPQYENYPSDLADLFRLSPQARAVLYLRSVDGLPFAEIARLLGAKEATLRRVASRARRQLRDTFLEESFDATS